MSKWICNNEVCYEDFFKWEDVKSIRQKWSGDCVTGNYEIFFDFYDKRSPVMICDNYYDYSGYKYTIKHADTAEKMRIHILDSIEKSGDGYIDLEKIMLQKRFVER